MSLAGRARRRCADRRFRPTRYDGPSFRPVLDAPARPQAGAGRISKGPTWTKDLVVPPPTAPVPRREPLRGTLSFARPRSDPAEVAWASSCSARLVPRIAGIEVTTEAEDEGRRQTFRSENRRYPDRVPQR